MGEAALADRWSPRMPTKVSTEVAEKHLGYIDGSPHHSGWQRFTWTLELLPAQLVTDTRVKPNSAM
jgi:hypothetical protein